MLHPLMVEVNKKLHRILVTDSPSLRQILEHFLHTKGKGIRPLLVLLCGEVAAAPTKRCIDLAVAVELLHMASLVHDDIVDQAEFRRTHPTIHSLWGEGNAVLVGDYFFGKLLGVISFYPDVVNWFADTIQNLVAGEFMQMDQQYSCRLSEEEYLDRIYCKTANFIATCCKISCLTDETPHEITEALTHYGYCLGMAYQLIDDLQDITESPFVLGKPVRQDISRGIFTLPYLRSFRAVSHLSDNLVPHESSITHESIDYTEKLALNYIQKSVSSLSVLPASTAKTELIRLALQTQKKIAVMREASVHAPSFD